MFFRPKKINENEKDPPFSAENEKCIHNEVSRTACLMQSAVL